MTRWRAGTLKNVKSLGERGSGGRHFLQKGFSPGVGLRDHERLASLAASPKVRFPMRPLALVVDDDDGVRYTIRSILEESDFDVADADSGEVALEMLKTSDFHR
jgi:hypothetical protein